LDGSRKIGAVISEVLIALADVAEYGLPVSSGRVSVRFRLVIGVSIVIWNGFGLLVLRVLVMVSVGPETFGILISFLGGSVTRIPSFRGRSGFNKIPVMDCNFNHFVSGSW
jgi:hypothetical protein